jgi:hypothetical protein
MARKARRRAPGGTARRRGEPQRGDGQRRVRRAISARRELAASHAGGRVWLNGREVGDADPRFAHLEASHD